MTYSKILRASSVLALLLGLFFNSQAHAEVAVIVHAENLTELSRKDIARIFLGKKKSFDDGFKAEAIDQNEGSIVRAAFFSNVLKKSEKKVRTHWAELMFTGRGFPPKQVGKDLEVLDLVAENPAMIGYIDAALVDDRVRVVYRF